MALYIPQSILHLARSLYVRPETYGPNYVTRLHDKQVKLLQTYFLSKQATSPLHAAVVKADDRYTPLDLVRADENELATDEEYNNNVQSNGPRRPYTADIRVISANNM